MPKLNRPIHFEIQGENPEKLAKFYSDVFGWVIKKWDSPDMDYWMIMTDDKDSNNPGINGGLLKRPCPAPALEQGTNAFTCTMNVESVDDMIKKVVKHGGKIAMPKFAIADMAWQAYCVDPENNVFGLHEEFKKVK
ncbi:MAG: VOC family protein [Nanoarchaeota archaeon]